VPKTAISPPEATGHISPPRLLTPSALDLTHKPTIASLHSPPPQFVHRVAKTVRKWLDSLGVNTLYIEPGSPWENGYLESFNGKLRDELLNGEIFDTLLEAQVLVERWRIHYNMVRPHSALNYRPPAPEADQPRPPGSATPHLTPLAIQAVGLT